jgi:hypothetical protein
MLSRSSQTQTATAAVEDRARVAKQLGAMGVNQELTAHLKKACEL